MATSNGQNGTTTKRKTRPRVRSHIERMVRAITAVVDNHEDRIARLEHRTLLKVKKHLAWLPFLIWQ